MTKTLFAAASALLLAGCSTYGAPGPGYPGASPYPGDPYGSPPGAYPGANPAPYPGMAPDAACQIMRSGDWRAWVNMMPGPGARPTLNVTGKVVVPTGGYQIRFEERLQVRETNPPQAFATMRVAQPNGAATQAVMTHDVRWQWPLSTQIGSLEIRCGDQTLATISPVETAH